MKKGKAKYELNRVISPANSYAASAHRRHICLLEFAIVLKLKNNLENSRGKMHWLQMNPP